MTESSETTQSAVEDAPSLLKKYGLSGVLSISLILTWGYNFWKEYQEAQVREKIRFEKIEERLDELEKKIK